MRTLHRMATATVGAFIIATSVASTASAACIDLAPLPKHFLLGAPARSPSFSPAAAIAASASGSSSDESTSIVGMWHIFGEINYRLLKVAASDGLHNKDAWLEQYMARYMDVNAAIHRINAAIQGHAAAASAPDEGAMRVLEPLVGVE